jgi:hypothetical protein
MIKEFQSRGLFGARDIHKTIVKLPFPKFDRTDVDHLELAELGKSCAKLANTFITRFDVDDLQARILGRLRAKLRDQLATQLEKIDVIVEALSSGRSTAAVAIDVTRKTRRKATQSENLFD